MSLNQNDIITQLEEAEKLKLEGDHTAALSLLEEILLLDPTNVSALEEIADNELSLEQYERAEKAAKQALKLDKDSYTALYILGFLASQTEDFAKSITHLTRANQLKPNNPEILRCLGWSLFCSGKQTQGIVTLERALNLDANNSLTLCDLGTAYLQTRDFSKAKALFSRTLDIDPLNTRAQECVQAVERLEKQLKKQ